MNFEMGGWKVLALYLQKFYGRDMVSVPYFLIVSQTFFATLLICDNVTIQSKYNHLFYF